MITAKEARFESLNRKKLNEIIGKLEEEQKKQIESGNLYASISISTDLSEDMRTKIKEELEDLGYSVSILNVNAEYNGALIDPKPWYDTLTIKWGETKDESK